MRPLISDEKRAALLEAPRPRRALPVLGSTAARGYPALADAREADLAVVPLLAVWEITLRCDLACRHCGSRAGAARPDELSTTEALDLVRQLAELGTREVALIGGEAYLRDDWLEIVRAIRARGMLPTMTTGGRGLDAAMARAAKQAGLYSVSVSIDGAEPTHDRLRGLRGSYRAALEAMANLDAAGIPFGANSQINRLSASELEGVLEAIAAAGAKSWQIQLTVAMGRAVDEPDVLLQPYDLLEVFPVLDRLAKRAAELGVNLAAGNNIGYFGPHERALRGRRPAGHSTGCGAGQLTMGIEADGTIKGCPSLGTARWAGGNVRETRAPRSCSRVRPRSPAAAASPCRCTVLRRSTGRPTSRTTATTCPTSSRCTVRRRSTRVKTRRPTRPRTRRRPTRATPARARRCSAMMACHLGLVLLAARGSSPPGNTGDASMSIGSGFTAVTGTFTP